MMSEQQENTVSAEASAEPQEQPATVVQTVDPTDATSESENTENTASTATEDPTAVTPVNVIGVAVSEPVAEPRTFYLWKALDDEVGIYVGQATRALECPNRATKFKPPEAGEGQAVYMYQGVWHVAPAKGTPAYAAAFKRTADLVFNIANSKVTAALADYTQAERLTFDQQLADAQAYQATGEASALLTGLAALRGIDVAEMAQRVVSRAAATTASFSVSALLAYQRTCMAISAGNFEDLPMSYLLGYPAAAA